jgi:hypothetical protein
MTYNAGIPLATDLISVSQGQLLANFQQLNTQFAVDHVAFNTGSGNGDGHHKQTTFNASVSPSAPTGTQSVLYPQTVGGLIQLFFRNATTTTQLTGASSVVANPGYVFLPGGLIMKWGVGAVTGSPVAFSPVFPTAAFAMIVVGTSTLYTGGFVVSALSASAYTVSRTSGSGATGYYYIALGN